MNTGSPFKFNTKQRGRKKGGANPNGGRHKKQVAGQTSLNFGSALPSIDHQEASNSASKTSSRQQNIPIVSSDDNVPSSSNNSDISLSFDSNIDDRVPNSGNNPEATVDNNICTIGTLSRNTEVEDMPQCDDDDDSSSEAEDDLTVEDDSTNYVEAPILTEYFEKLQNRIVKDGKQGPREYDQNHNTFWIEPPSPYFALYSGPADPKKLYHPRVFLWSPHRLITTMLKCPDCKQKLNSKGFNSDPRARRVVDIDSCFYIMSSRYRCTNKSCKTSLNAHDSRIMEQLPSHLQAEFPAYLTHRSAVSKHLGDLLRIVMQNGMGVHRLQRALREFHTLRHARLHLQYLNSLVHRQKYPTFHDIPRGNNPIIYKRFSSFKDPEGYAGYVPSTGYLRLVYTALIDQLQPLMDKELAILGGIILKGDHSFKVPKHMAKLGGSSAFTALYTLCNEYEEIRLQLLVPTKSTTHLEAPLKEMMHSYRLYNHQQPDLFFTDNVKGDRRLLERSLPSLKRTLHTNNTHTHNIQQSTNEDHQNHPVPFLQLPSSVSVNLVQTNEQVDQAVQAIRNKSDGISDSLVVGFDCEWNYNPITNATGKVSLIQVACADSVWLFRIKSSEGVPRALALLISDSTIVKAGRNVKGDLKKLNRDFGIAWKGALELGAFCRRRGAIERGTLGLSDISALVLGGKLSKDSNLRLSDWESGALDENQVMYAALDAWASFKIFESVKDLNVFGKILPDYIPAGLHCSLQYLGSPVAFGHIAEQVTQDNQTNSVEIPFTVTRVGIPGALVMTKEGEAKTLSEFGCPPFVIPVPISLLRTENPDQCIPSPSLIPSENDTSVVPERNPDEYRETNDDYIETASIATSSSSSDNDSNDIPIAHELISTAGSQYLPNLTSEQQYTQSPNPRILKDIFHLMDMIKVPKKHLLAKEFKRRFRDAIFVANSEDRNRIEKHLRTIGHSWDYMLTKNPAWVLRRCRRTVPQPEDLYPVVQNLFAEYGPLECDTTRKPLFDHETWKQARNVLKAIRMGEVSDPPEIPLYFEMGVDKNNLPMYRCSRGTNSLEGGVHQNIIRKFGSFGAGPHMTNCMLADYRLRHNIDVGSKNRHGRKHLGHYDPWLTQTISNLEESLPLDDKSKKRYDPSASLIVKNALKLRKSDETFGITPFPQEIASNIHIDTVSTENNNNHGLDPLLPIRLSTRLVLPIGATSNQKGKMYKYIASRLKTRYAVTPIHTRQEFVLFSNIMPRSTDIPIDWNQKAQQWNSNHANGNDIFYKTPEILKSHHKSWCSGQVIDRTITRNNTELITMREQLQSPSRSNDISLPPPPNIPTDATITLSNTNSFVLPPPILSNGVSNSSLSITPAQRPHSTSTRQQQHEPFVPQGIQPYIPQDIRYYPPPTSRPLQPPSSFTPSIPPSVPPTPLILPQHSHISLSPNVLTHRSSSTVVPISTWELPRKRTRTCRCGLANCKERAQSKLCQNRNPS